MIGTSIGQYQVLRKLGSGGMGEVYLAEDMRLKRKVALKVLPESLASDPESRTRLLREAQAASQLNHPNIVTVYSVEELDNRTFLIMEYVEGTTLSEHLGSHPSLRDILELITQVTQGLERAHRAGVVHRDLKPANILIDAESRARILDFGIAKLAGATKLTRTGTTLGTISYSSPEQISGEDVDARSDIFSLGVILYEQLTRQLPFTGDHESTIIYSILSEDPKSLRLIDPEIPESVERVVLRCLAKRPENRYQSAGDLITDLRKVATDSKAEISAPVDPDKQRTARKRAVRLAVLSVGVVLAAVATFVIPRYFQISRSPSRIMLAVLPFDNEGADDKEYFADGITEEITARLARVSGLGVIARTSSRMYKNTDKAPQQIATELGVQFLLMGTIRWQVASGSDARVKVMPELIRISDETNIWGDLYDRSLTQIFDVQSEIAQQVVTQLNVTLLANEQTQLTSKPTENLEAYDYYLRGIEYMDRNTDWHQTSELSIPMFERAIALDPRFVAARAKLAQMLIERYWHTERQEKYIVRARNVLDSALALDPLNPEAHVALGAFLYHEGNEDSALAEFRHVLRLNPDNTYALMESGHASRRSGRYSDAAAKFRRVVELDPRSQITWLELGRTYRYMRQYERADSLYAKAATIAPEWQVIYDEWFWSAADRLDFELARKVLERGEKVVRPAANLSTLWAWLYLLEGQPDEALNKLSMDIADSVYYYYLKSWAHRNAGDSAASLAAADSCRILAETRLKDFPEATYLHENVGLAYALLGRRDEALSAANRALKSDSHQTDAYNSIGSLQAASIAFGLSDRPEDACNLLDTLLDKPSFLSRRIVGYSFEWMSLHGYPRFDELVNRPESEF